MRQLRPAGAWTGVGSWRPRLSPLGFSSSSMMVQGERQWHPGASQDATPHEQSGTRPPPRGFMLAIVIHGRSLKVQSQDQIDRPRSMTQIARGFVAWLISLQNLPFAECRCATSALSRPASPRERRSSRSSCFLLRPDQFFPVFLITSNPCLSKHSGNTTWRRTLSDVLAFPLPLERACLSHHSRLQRRRRACGRYSLQSASKSDVVVS